MFFLYELYEYANNEHSDFWPTHKTLWPVEVEIPDTRPVVSRLRTKASNVTINQCLSFSLIASPCTAAERLELRWTEQRFSLCCCNIKRNYFSFTLNVICLKFLDQKFLLQLFLSCDNFCVFSYLSIVGKRDKILLVTLIIFTTFLHRVCSVTAEKDRRLGLTKIESCNRLNCVFSE